jgi:hypothetical protein
LYRVHLTIDMNQTYHLLHSKIVRKAVLCWRKGEGDWRKMLGVRESERRWERPISTLVHQVVYVMLGNRLIFHRFQTNRSNFIVCGYAFTLCNLNPWAWLQNGKCSKVRNLMWKIFFQIFCWRKTTIGK